MLLSQIFMSHFFMFVPTKAHVRLDNGRTGHAQVTGVILCCFPYCPIIYPSGPVYYCTGNLYNTISAVALKCYVGFQKVTS